MSLLNFLHKREKREVVSDNERNESIDKPVNQSNVTIANQFESLTMKKCDLCGKESSERFPLYISGDDPSMVCAVCRSKFFLNREIKLKIAAEIRSDILDAPPVSPENSHNNTAPKMILNASMEQESISHFPENTRSSFDRVSEHGFRDDLNCEFRSSWEANIARIFNANGIPWEYEAERFLDKEKNEVYYLPDFLLPENVIVEVKGMWDRGSLAKVSAFHKNNPAYRMLFVDSDVYYELNQRYSKEISDWEDSPCGIQSNVLVVVGMAFVSKESTLSSLRTGQEVLLTREPDNLFDCNAILVTTREHLPIGHISSDWALIYAQKLDRGMLFDAKILSIENKAIKIKVKRNNSDFPSTYHLFNQ